MKKIWDKYSYALILLILSCSLAVTLSLRSTATTEENFLKITVSEGDTLWEIANQYSEHHTYSNKDFISWVKKYNSLDGDNIFPGEEIMIPVNYESDLSTELASAVGE